MNDFILLKEYLRDLDIYKPIMIRAEDIDYIHYGYDITVVCMKNGKIFYVKETVEEIYKMVKLL